MEIKLTEMHARKALKAWQRSLAAAEYGEKLSGRSIEEIGEVMEAIREALKEKDGQV